MKPYFFDHEVYISHDNNVPENWISGGNEKGLLIVCQSNDITDENLTLLTKILAAINYQFEKDCLCLKLPEKNSISIQSLLKEKQINHLLCFGLKADRIGLSMESQAYTPLRIQNYNFLFGHSLEQIKTKTELKRVLWNALKNMFTN